jgi:PhzF family phenazine biosynthesis protein
MRFVQVDAFAEQAFRGNPAVVFEPGPAIDAALMQQIAMEMNVSETAFLVPEEDGLQLRWFTPVSEVDLCGHATLAASHALWNEWGFEGTELLFNTRSGRLRALRGEKEIWLDFPSEPVRPVEVPGLRDALGDGIEVKSVSANRMDLLVELGSETVVARLLPDLRWLESLGVRGLIVTAGSDPGKAYDFVSRFFAPSVGVDEDPVTGSAHCALCPYWAERLGRSQLLGFQLSRRGGLVRVRMRGDRVDLGGRAVTVFTGRMHVND